MGDIFILTVLLVFTNNSSTSFTQEYVSEQTCNDARKVLINQSMTNKLMNYYFITCTKK